MIFFITGASGSGKTACIPYLQKILPDMGFYDFDDIGVPENADKKWRQETTEVWIKRLLSEERDACLCGQMVLGEILACPSAEKLGKVNGCFLDVSDYERVQRIKDRGINQDMLNWSAWLRMHHHDPQWEQRVIRDDAWEGLDFSRWNTLDDWSTVANTHLIDTTNKSLKIVAPELSQWIS